ncbi:MAG: J domain-containing protein [Clostridia bacterium]|nr:J domain-containing protein [Clostridia bacterium]
MKNPYTVLGVPSDASDEEIKKAYHKLARKYHPDNYSSNPDFAELANEKMQEINEAYDEIKRQRESGGGSSGYNGNSYQGQNNIYMSIRIMINSGHFAQAEQELEKIKDSDKTAEWHYLKSIVLMRRGWTIEAMRELGIACGMDPQNQEYARTKMEFERRTGAYGNMYGGSQRTPYGRADQADQACDCCSSLICADCCCECMGGDLISCC